MDLVTSAVPHVHEAANDIKRQEFRQLKKQKEDIDSKAQKQVRAVLWSGYGLLMTQVEMCFRFTFWDFDWTVMGPITFFAASSFLLADYAYFLVTSSDLEMERQLRCPLGGDHSRGRI